MSDNEWIAEAVVQFSRSPMWRTPVNDFVDENCCLFDNDDEMKFEYTEIHNKFRVLIDRLLTDFVSELGVSMEDALKAIKASLKNPSHRARADTSRMLKFIFSVDDFRIFHRMMLKHNLQLDVLASAAMDSKNDAQQRELEQQLALATNGDIDDEEALRMALAMSLENDQGEKALALEDAQLQEALALSLQEENERVARVKEEIELEAKLLAQKDEQAAQQLLVQKLTRLEAQREHNIQSLEEKTLIAREENIIRSISAQQASPAENMVPTNVSSVPDVPLVASTSASYVANVHPVDQSQASISSSAPDSPVPVAPVAAVAPPAVTPPRVIPQPTATAAAPPVLSPPNKRMGMSALPPISQPPLNTLKQHVVTAAQAQPKADPAPATAPKAKPTKEELEQRAKYMREQRERILAQNKASRQKELAEYAEKNNMPAPVARADGAADAAEKQLTVDIARRLREDILGEAKK